MADTAIVRLGNDSFPSMAPEWSLSTCVSLSVTIVGGLLNLSVLSTYLLRPSLRKPFTVYVINVLIIDLILSVAHGPINFLEKYYPGWYLGLAMCTFYNFLSYTFQSLINIAHSLIALNRIWAVTFPFSYRTQHTTKVAVIICVSVWFVVHSCQLPTALVTSVVNRMSDNATSLQCTVDPSRVGSWSLITEVAFYMVPLVLVLISYPYVCYKSFFSSHGPQIAPLSTNQPNGSATIAPSGGASVGLTQGRKKGKRTLVCGKPLRGSPTGFITLSLMFVSVVVCLLPNEVYFTWVMATNNDFSNHDIYMVVDTLQRLTLVVDPILIVLANVELRKFLLNLCYTP